MDRGEVREEGREGAKKEDLSPKVGGETCTRFRFHIWEEIETTDYRLCRMKQIG